MQESLLLLLDYYSILAQVTQLEDMLAHLRKKYEMLRIEFKQSLTANEQTGPINNEMRNLVTSLQVCNSSLSCSSPTTLKRQDITSDLE